MGKRAGTYVTVREVLDEVGADAARFFLVPLGRRDDGLRPGPGQKQSSENPVYYVQYAHARTASILRAGRARSATRTATSTLLTTRPSWR